MAAASAVSSSIIMDHSTAYTAAASPDTFVRDDAAASAQPPAGIRNRIAKAHRTAPMATDMRRPTSARERGGSGGRCSASARDTDKHSESYLSGIIAHRGLGLTTATLLSAPYRISEESPLLWPMLPDVVPRARAHAEREPAAADVLNRSCKSRSHSRLMPPEHVTSAGGATPLS